jgi:hypothetical protein
VHFEDDKMTDYAAKERNAQDEERVISKMFIRRLVLVSVVISATIEVFRLVVRRPFSTGKPWELSGGVSLLEGRPSALELFITAPLVIIVSNEGGIEENEHENYCTI